MGGDMEDRLCVQNMCANQMSTTLNADSICGWSYTKAPEPQSYRERIEFPERVQAQLRKRAEVAGVGNDECVTKLLDLLQYQESTFGYLQKRIDEMSRSYRSIAEKIESRIMKAEIGTLNEDL